MAIKILRWSLPPNVELTGAPLLRVRVERRVRCQAPAKYFNSHVKRALLAHKKALLSYVAVVIVNIVGK